MKKKAGNVVLRKGWKEMSKTTYRKRNEEGVKKGKKKNEGRRNKATLFFVLCLKRRIWITVQVFFFFKY